MPDPANVQLVADRLNSRDRRFKEHVTQDDLARYQADMATDLTPANISELGRAIDQTKDPKLRAILMQELDRLRGLASNLLGPVNPPAQFAPPVGGPRDAVWRPAEQPMQPQRIPTMPFKGPNGLYDG